jgi:hypothetical protein
MKYAMILIGLLMAAPALAGSKLDNEMTAAYGSPVYVIRCRSGAGCLKDTLRVCGTDYIILADVPLAAIRYGNLRVSNDTERTVACEVVK